MSNAYTAGDELTADALNNPTGSYWYSETVEYTGSGTFQKANYPGIRAIKIRVQAAGGGSGGCATNAAGNTSCASGGGGGSYGEKFILASALSASETVTVGAGGSAGSAGANAGGVGGTSSFGSHVTAVGGGAGNAGATGSTLASVGGGAGGTCTGGDVNIPGGDADNGLRNSATVVMPSGGGNAILAGRKRATNGTTSQAGGVGLTYGGGASGAYAYASQTQAAGALGGAGIILVDVLF
jgi:hypothetical protein